MAVKKQHPRYAFGLRNKTRRTVAEEACFHILSRYANDANFRWYMTGTESLAKCVAAEAAFQEQATDVILQKLYAGVSIAGGDRKAEVCILRDKLERLHSKLRGLREVHMDHDPEAPMLDELIRLVDA